MGDRQRTDGGEDHERGLGGRPPLLLAVVPTNRGPAVARDQAEALLAAAGGPAAVVLVDDRGDLEGLDDGRAVHVVPGRLDRDKRYAGFKAGEGLEAAIRRGIPFDLAWLVDDDALPVGPGAGAWARRRLATSGAGLLGVVDRVRYAEAWPLWRPWLAERLPEALWLEPAEESLFFASLFAPGDLVREMDRRGLLVPRGYREWTLWPDVYWSWCCQALGWPLEACGSMDCPEPPLYLDHPDAMTHAPQPWILHPDFLVYHSVRAVPGHAEEAVRARCRAWRGTRVPPENPQP